jgi:hypothetical protein
MLIIIGVYLIFRSFRRIKKIDLRIEQLKRNVRKNNLRIKNEEK